MKRKRFLCIITTVIILISLISTNYVFAEDDALQIEFENYLEQNIGFSQTSTADGGNMAGISKISVNTYSYTIAFDVKHAGEYTMQIAAASYAEGLLVNYSDVSWTLNGSTPKSLNESETKELLDSSGTPQRSLFTIEKAELVEGENILTLSGGKRNNSPMVTFYLDYAKFMLNTAEKPQPVEGRTRYEIENITSDFIVSDKNASGGNFQIYKLSSTEDVIQHFEGTIDNNGEYILSFACGNYSNMDFLSQLYFSVNGGEYIEINNSNCSKSQLEALENTSLQETFGLYKYTYNQGVSLEAGEFTIDIKAVKRINTAPGEGVFFSFDYIDVEEKKEPEPVIGHGRVEIEDITSNGIINDANTSGRKYQVYRSAKTDDVIQRFSFQIDETGPHTINVAAGAFAKMPYLSQLFISINGGTYIELNKENCYITQLEELADAGMRETFNLYSYLYKDDINLSKGINTIDVKGIERTNTAATPGVYFSLDYVEVMPVKQLTGLYGKVDNGSVVCGTDEQLRIFNGEDRELTPADISAIKYTVEDEKIASIDENGVIHGRNFGSAVIHAYIERKGVTAEMEYTVYVTDKFGVYLTDGRRAGNTVSVTANAAQEYTTKHKLLVLVYGTDGEYMTSIKKAYTIDIDNMSVGERKVLTQIVDAANTDKIGLFMVNSEDDASAVYNSIIL